MIPLTNLDSTHSEWKNARIQQKTCRSACVIQGLVRGVLARTDFGKKIQAGSEINKWLVSVQQRRKNPKLARTLNSQMIQNPPVMPKAFSTPPLEEVSWRVKIVNFFTKQMYKPRFSHDVYYSPDEPFAHFRHTTDTRPIS